jgi:hypothetical protein
MDINKIIEEGEKEFVNRFPHKVAEVIDDFGSTVKSDFLDWHKAQQQKLLQSIVEEIEKEIEKNKDDYEMGVCSPFLDSLKAKLTTNIKE